MLSLKRSSFLTAPAQHDRHQSRRAHEETLLPRGPVMNVPVSFDSTCRSPMRI